MHGIAVQAPAWETVAVQYHTAKSELPPGIQQRQNGVPFGSFCAVVGYSSIFPHEASGINLRQRHRPRNRVGRFGRGSPGNRGRCGRCNNHPRCFHLRENGFDLTDKCVIGREG